MGATGVMELTPVLVLCGLLGLATAGAAFRGAAAEHTGVVIFSLAWMASLIVDMLLPAGQSAAPLLLIDAGLLLGLIALAWKSPRPWPVWAAGFQLLSIAVGGAYLMRPEQVGLPAYWTASEWAGYAAAACLAVGAWMGERQPQED
ncbi:MAG: hypothetical protein IT546_00435 [Caulobacteraceae bacterium]|nr:hypothetical protein [Caulobacteraceae bacterium]